MVVVDFKLTILLSPILSAKAMRLPTTPGSMSLSQHWEFFLEFPQKSIVQ